MDISKLVIGALSGSVIGYITNWLAIKMLFRPHEQKKLLGIKVPFTPGLIPKERDRIAESIGNSVGEYLLTKETMVESLCNEDMVSTLKGWIETKIEELHESDESIENGIKAILGDKYHEVNKYATNGINKFIIKTLNDPKTLNEIDEFIIDKIDDLFQIGVSEFLEYDIVKNIKNLLEDKAKEYKNSENTQIYIRKYLNDELKISIENQKIIGDIIPKEATESIKTLIYQNRDEICKGLARVVREPSVEGKIKQAISDMVSSKLSPMIAMFIKPNTIYELIAAGISNYLEKEENQEEVMKMIDEKIDLIIAMDIEGILKKVGTDNCYKIVGNISEVLTNNIIKDEIIHKIFDSAIKALSEFSTLRDVLNMFSDNMDVYIVDKLLNFIHDSLKKDSTEEFLNNTSIKVIESLLKNRLKDILPRDKHKVKDALSKFAVDMYVKLINNKAGNAIELLNIPKIIEGKIRGFETEYLEKLILDIANKELKAITWLGALLGFFMGIISYFIAL